MPKTLRDVAAEVAEVAKQHESYAYRYARVADHRAEAERLGIHPKAKLVQVYATVKGEVEFHACDHTGRRLSG